MKKDAEQISVDTVTATFLLLKQMVLHICQKQPLRVFRNTAVQNIFGSTGGKILMLVMTASGSFTFDWFLTVKTSLLCFLIQLIN